MVVSGAPVTLECNPVGDSSRVVSIRIDAVLPGNYSTVGDDLSDFNRFEQTSSYDSWTKTETFVRSKMYQSRSK